MAIGKFDFLFDSGIICASSNLLWWKEEVDINEGKKMMGNREEEE